MDTYLTLDDAAAVIGVSKNTIANWTARGKPAFGLSSAVKRKGEYFVRADEMKALKQMRAAVESRMVGLRDCSNMSEGGFQSAITQALRKSQADNVRFWIKFREERPDDDPTWGRYAAWCKAYAASWGIGNGYTLSVEPGPGYVIDAGATRDASLPSYVVDLIQRMGHIEESLGKSTQRIAVLEGGIDEEDGGEFEPIMARMDRLEIELDGAKERINQETARVSALRSHTRDNLHNVYEHVRTSKHLIEDLMGRMEVVEYRIAPVPWRERLADGWDRLLTAALWWRS